MKRYQVYTRLPRKQVFELVHNGEIDEDDVVTWDDMASSALKSEDEFWIPGTELIVVSGDSAQVLRVKMEYVYK